MKLNLNVQKKRVLHLRSSGGVYGAENVIIEIAKHSGQYGWESIIGAINHIHDPYPLFLKTAAQYGIETVIFQSRRQIDFTCCKEINEFCKKNDISIIHSHGYKENFFSLISKNSIPRIATNHLWKGASLKSRFYCFSDAIFIRFFDEVVGVSDHIIEQMKRFRIKNVHKIPNGIDTQRFTPMQKSDFFMEKYCLTSSDLVLGMISSLSAEKNHQIVIKALKEIQHSGIKLLIVGDGALKDDINTQINQAGLTDKVVLAGTEENIVDVLSVIDIFLLPSLIEGLPMALLEAMACEKPVISSKVGEVPNVIHNNENGILVEPGNLQQLIDAINKLICDKELRHNLSKSARDTVVKKYSSDKMAFEYCELYNRL